MEFPAGNPHSLDHQCLACLSTEEIAENISENPKIIQLFKGTFNFELQITESLPKSLCSSCYKKLNDAAQFLAQVQSSLQYFQEIKHSESVNPIHVKEEEHAPIQYQSEEDHTENDDNQSYRPSDSHSDSDNEPLINYVPKRKKKKNAFNAKLKRIPLAVIEDAMEEYREKCKENSNCVLCDFKGLNIRNLSCHMIFKHKDTKNHWCLRCNLMVDDINSHKKTHTNKIWCKFCKKDITRCHYMEHLKSHAGLDYSCEECSKKFISQKYLEEHTARHKQQKPLQCVVCNKAFKLLKSLEDHVLTHGRYKCEICEKNFEIPELLTSHLCTGKEVKNDDILVLKNVDKREHDGEVYYVLDDVVLEDEKGDNLKNNTLKTEDDTIKVKPEIQVESLTCHFCQRTYKTAYKLQKHIEAHMGIFLAKCSFCDKGFSSKADLANHERVHTKEKPFICSSCGKGFVSGATLRIHMKQHTGKPEVCELCQKRFSRKSELKLHLQKHRGERPFLCTDCGKSFAQKSHLTCHLTMHSEDRPYACMMCDKAFKKKELLKHHMKLHGEKRFKCSICSYECHKKYRLQQHMKMHEGKTGLKINPCQLCTRSFSSIQLLNIHMGSVHSVIV